jgi:hypothetical protein
MRRFRVPLDTALLAIALVAIEMAVWNLDYTSLGVPAVMTMRGTLGAASGLALAYFLLRKGRGDPAFLAGFLKAGIAASLLYGLFCYLVPWSVYRVLQKPTDDLVFIGFLDAFPGVEASLLSSESVERLVFQMICMPIIVMLDAIPILTIAALGGVAARRKARNAPGLPGWFTRRQAVH